MKRSSLLLLVLSFVLIADAVRIAPAQAQGGAANQPREWAPMRAGINVMGRRPTYSLYITLSY